MHKQESLFDNSKNDLSGKTEVNKALNQLFTLARKYKTTAEYFELLKFVSKFKFYSPFNSMLIHVQKPGATYAAPAQKWVNEFGYVIKPNAQPLVILQPMGPVMFIFDVKDTEPGPNAVLLPSNVTDPFAVAVGKIGNELDRMIENAKRDGVRIDFRNEGSQSAGSIRHVGVEKFEPLQFYKGKTTDGRRVFTAIQVHYTLLVNSGLSREATFVTLLHELAHLYCGHLGTINKKWWPDRRGLNTTVEEIEAESVAYIVAQRFGIQNPSEKYLSNYCAEHAELPDLSLEAIMRSAGLIESMAKTAQKPRGD